jgi:hypothetical protein
MRFAVVLLAACGSSTASQPAPAQPQHPVAHQPDTPKVVAEDVNAHRQGESQAQDALAVTCDEPKPWTQHARCMPSCYPTQDPDARADKNLTGAVELQHLVCKKPNADVYIVADDADAAHLAVRKLKKRAPPHKKGTWQATIETWFRDTYKLPKSDGVAVATTWHDVAHPLTKETMQCVTLAHYARVFGKLDACGVAGKTTCEAAGSAAARGINVIHYRLAEAKQLQATGKSEDCQQAALEAIAVARGLPRWRQYKKLNVSEWTEGLTYATRFDGLLDEDSLFAAATALGSEAESVYSACGGAKATTTPEQEQSFHACW